MFEYRAVSVRITQLGTAFLVVMWPTTGSAWFADLVMMEIAFVTVNINCMVQCISYTVHSSTCFCVSSLPSPSKNKKFVANTRVNVKHTPGLKLGGPIDIKLMVWSE